jgi:hypothetical protein
MIRHDYPNLHAWVRRLYWDVSETTKGGAFMKTTNFDVVSTDSYFALPLDLCINLRRSKLDIAKRLEVQVRLFPPDPFHISCLYEPSPSSSAS